MSRLGLGTATWGRDTDPDDAAAQLVAFREAGGTLLDIGPWYVCEQTEPLVGRLLQDVVPRDELVLAVKSGGPIGPAAAARGLSRGGLLTALDNSMLRLGVDSVDLWQLHGWDQRVPMEEVLSAVDVAISSEDTGRLQLNLLRSHACGVGEPFPTEVVRGAMLLRAQ